MVWATDVNEYPTFSLKGLWRHPFLSIKGNSLIHRFCHLCLLENNLSDNPGQHHFLGLGQLLGSLPGRLLDAVGDDRHDHEDVAKPEQDPDDEAWMASKQMSTSSTGKKGLKEAFELGRCHKKGPKVKSPNLKSLKLKKNLILTQLKRSFWSNELQILRHF